MYQSIVILSGAGISAESGLPTFRGAGGLWRNYRAEDLATPEAFAENPALVHAFYNQRRQQLLSAEIKPNTAHRALVQLQNEWHGEFTLVTQNVDNLHELAGSRDVIHMHGELLRMRCTHCTTALPVDGDIASDDTCPACGLAGGLRPDVVWFGEMPRQLDVINAALQHCDLFIAVGTSGNVYPAAGFVATARAAGAHTVEINLETTAQAGRFARHYCGKAAEVLPGLVAQLLAGATNI